MFGTPRDVDGECNARLYMGDDYGDGTTTVRCSSEPGHDGKHRETFGRAPQAVEITWVVDESAECSRCNKRSPSYTLQDGLCCFTCPVCEEERRITMRDDGKPYCYICGVDDDDEE